MAKLKDQSPISLQRVNRTHSLTINFDAAGGIAGVEAQRFQHTVSEQTAPVFLGTIKLSAAEVTTAIANKIADLDTLIDAKDI